MFKQGKLIFIVTDWFIESSLYCNLKLYRSTQKCRLIWNIVHRSWSCIIIFQRKMYQIFWLYFSCHSSSFQGKMIYFNRRDNTVIFKNLIGARFRALIRELAGVISQLLSAGRRFSRSLLKSPTEPINRLFWTCLQKFLIASANWHDLLKIIKIANHCRLATQNK